MSGITFADLKGIIDRCAGELDSGDLSENDARREFTDIGYDSLAVLEIASQIQREYGLQIPDEAIEGMDSPQSVIDYVNERLAVV